MLLSPLYPTDRKKIIQQGRQNAGEFGRLMPDGSARVYVSDIQREITIGRTGLEHGLRRPLETNAPVALKAGEILSNAILMNDMNPKIETADSSYLLVGAAKDTNGEILVVRFIVNRFTGELVDMDTLYAVDTRSETYLQNQQKKNRSGHQPLRPVGKPTTSTDSVISVSDFLDFVNRYFPSNLPESVLRHYGYERRPFDNDGKDEISH